MVVIKIFDATDTNFNTAGNIIIEPLYCKETKKKSLNGWYIDVEILIKYKQYIEQDKLCVVQTKSKLNPQAFRIKDIEYTLDKIVFKAYHVMFDAEDYFLLDVRPTNMNGLNTLNYINDRTDKVSPFSMLSNVENTGTAYFIRKSLLEAWAIIEERWQGAFDADNWNISFLTSVGSDKGETVRYGKNLQGMNVTEDWSGVCTKLYPVGQDELMLPEKFLESEIQYNEPYTRTIKFDTELDEEDQTTANLLQELRTNATNYLNENSVPKVCYEINSNINQDMEIGDIIAVKHPLCDISTEVLEYEYDLLTKKVIKLVFGNYTKNVKKKFQAITDSIEAIREAVSKQETVINNQTNIINSLNKNGYVYIDDNEILILDALPKESAQNVWRFGLGGIGFSSNGYEGPFEVAMTMDGQINANFITTGTLSVARIEGLANFISETNSQLAQIEINANNITELVETTEEIEQEIETITDTTGTAEGKTIYIDDSSDNTIISAKFDGETSQATRSGKNIFNKDATAKINGANKTTLNTGVRATSTIAGIYKYFGIEIGQSELLGKTITVSSTMTPSSNNNGCVTLYFGNSSTMAVASAGIAINETGSYTGTLASSFPTNCDRVYALIYGNRNGTGNVDDYVDYTNLQIEISNQATSYEDYGVMPSPDYPSLINNLEAKNIFNGEMEQGSLVGATGLTNPATNRIRTKDFIDVIEGETYALSGQGLKIITMVFLYDSNENYLGRVSTSWSAVPYIFTISSGVSKIKFLFARENTADLTPSYVQNIQLERNSIAAPYVPYNNLEVKVVNKNIFISDYSKYRQSADYRICDINLKQGETYTIKATLTGTAVTGCVVGIVPYGEKYADFSSVLSLCINTAGTASAKTVTVNSDWTSPKLVVYATDEATFNSIFENYNVQLEEGSTNTDYIEHKEQTVYFPLEQGQKLYQGSYLADDGIHHTRRHITFNGSENNWYAGGRQFDDCSTYYYYNATTCPKENDEPTPLICDKFIYNATAYNERQDIECVTNNINVPYGLIIVQIKRSRLSGDTVNGFKVWLQSNPITVEYQLEQEEIIPYTVDQQAAWNNIMALMTYKNITNIYSDAYAHIEYVKDNGLDIYETKHDANRKYIETIEKFAEQQITNESIIGTVSQTITTVSNNYNELKTQFNDYAPVGDVVSLQNSVQEIQTSTYTKTEVNEKLTDGSVTKVSTTAGTFDNNGLTIEKTDAKTKGNFNERGVTVFDATSGTNKELLFAGYDENLNETIVRTNNLTVEKYFTLENTSRKERYVNPVLGGHGEGTFIL